MTNLLLMADEKDDTLGSFFDSCIKTTQEHASILDDCSLKVFNSNKLLTNIQYSCYIEGLKDLGFICGAFMHGNETSLLCGEQEIVTEDDSKKFKNSIVYFCSCNAGKKLLRTIVESGKALAAVGYKDAFYVQKYFYMENVFSKCATSLFKYFFQNNSLIDSIYKMQNEYTDAIDSVYHEDPIVASFLLADRDSIVYYGNKNLNYSNLSNL